MKHIIGFTGTNGFLAKYIKGRLDESSMKPLILIQ